MDNKKPLPGYQVMSLCAGCAEKLGKIRPLEEIGDSFGFIRCGLCGLPAQGCRYKLYPPIKPRYQKASGGGERARAGRGQHELF